MTNDFSKGKVSGIIIAQAVPLMLAQLVQLLYNVVDRIYIGHLRDVGSLALTGVGLVFPLTTLIAAFTNLFGNGGTPLFSIARGAGRRGEAEKIMGNSFFLLAVSSLLLMILCYIFRRPVMYLFGASDATYSYADAYLKIYLLGTPCSMIATGMNGYINAQGYPAIGMLTTVFGAILNLILDPVFIFGFHMGIAGAALATVISQTFSAVWVIRFLRGRRAVIHLKRRAMKPEGRIVKRITGLGTAGFMVQGTNCLVQVVCNVTLKSWGGSLGDLYVGVMTVINSIREICSLPIHGLTSGAQPVLGFNFGAGEKERVREGIRFMSFLGIIYTVGIWLVILLKPGMFLHIFTNDTAMLTHGVRPILIHFFGFCFMALQFSGQATFTGLGFSKRAIFFSILRKAIIVVPLTILLPHLGFGVDGVFLAEPISNFIGGTACFTTMYFTVYRKLVSDLKDQNRRV